MPDGRLGSNPFPGLRHFELSEAYLFFGREGQSDEIIKRLRLHRFLAVVGTSGSGKSSLIRAGLLPALYGGQMTHAGSGWHAAIMRPGSNPIGNLARALATAGVLAPEEEADSASLDVLFLESTLRRSASGLVDAIQQAHLGPGQNVLILVDQMEELFRFAETQGMRQEDQAAAFIKLLLEATRQTEIPIHVVITMRSDYIGDCARFRDLPEAVNEGLYLIPRLTREQRKQAITGPVAVSGATIAPRLVTRLLNDGGDDPDQLPILQHALMRTWDCWAQDHAPDEPMDLRHYDAIGGLAMALSLHADEAWKDLPDERHREIAKRLFQALTEKGADNREVRRPTRISEIMTRTGAALREVLTTVESFRRPGRSFLMPPSDVALDADSVLDISHESLIRGWQRLKEWVEEEASSAVIFRRLAETAALHSEGKAGLWRDPDLQIALAWREKENPNEVWARRYHPRFREAISFLEASAAARDAEQREQERRHTEELRRARRFVAIATLGLIVLGALGLYAWVEARSARTAEAAANEQKARALASEMRAQESARLAQANERKAEASANAERAAAAAATRAEAAAVASQKQAEKMAHDAKVAENDFRIEVLRSRERSLDDKQTISSMADMMLDHSSPMWQIYAHRVKESALTQLGNHGEAIQQLNSILESDPDNLPARSSRAYEYLLVGDPKAAADDLEPFVAANPRSSIGYLNLGIARGMLQQYAPAVEAIRQAIANYQPANSGMYESELSPDIRRATGRTILVEDGPAYNAALWYEIAVLYALDPKNENRFAEALREADREADRQAARYGESMDPYLIALDWLWLHLRVHADDYGGFAAQGALWARVAAIQPRFASWATQFYAKFQDEREHDPSKRYPTLAKWVAEQKRARGRPSSLTVSTSSGGEREVRALMVEAQELDSRVREDDQMQLALVEKVLNDALRLGQCATQPNELCVRLLLHRAEIRYRAKHNTGAREDCHEILKQDPHNGKAYYYLAVTDEDDAARMKDYEAALKNNPMDGSSLSSFSSFLADKQPERAMSLLQTYVRLWPYYSSVRRRLADLQLKNGRQKEALETINVGISIDPQNLSLYDARKQIELKMDGATEQSAALHLATGYRAAGDALLRQGLGSQALSAYLKSIETAYALQPAGVTAEDIRTEQEVSVRALTNLMTSRYSSGYARKFWQNLASTNGVAAALQNRATQEVSRLAGAQ
jgi:conflict system STAND superfamily ATPase/tetratricopeptide repeat protein